MQLTDTSEEIKTLQEHLNKFLQSEDMDTLKVDGVFGKKTEDAYGKFYTAGAKNIKENRRRLDPSTLEEQAHKPVGEGH